MVGWDIRGQQVQIIIARHGESDANVEQIISNRNLPHNLTEQGRMQAHKLSETLISKNIAAIYASPIRRAQQTARIVAEKRHLPINAADALCEFDCGIMEGRGDGEAWQAYLALVAAWDEESDYDRRIDGGESFNVLDVISETAGLNSALIVPCNMCPAVTVAVRERKPFIQLKSLLISIQSLIR